MHSILIPMDGPGDHCIAKQRPVAFLGDAISDSNFEKKKPRVLFFHGALTNPDIAKFLLAHKNWDKFFDFVIPGALFQAVHPPQEVQDMLELTPLINLGIYKEGHDIFHWNTHFQANPSTIPDAYKKSFQDNIKDYIEAIDATYGPFDGVMGFSEGGAVLNCILGMKEQGSLDKNVLKSVRFFIHLAPFTSPLSEGFSIVPKDIPTLVCSGIYDNSIFLEALEEYGNGFAKHYDVYRFDGKHEYPIVSDTLTQKIKHLLTQVG